MWTPDFSPNSLHFDSGQEGVHCSSTFLNLVLLDHYRCFEVCSADDSLPVVVEPAELNHYIPLPAYKVQGRLLISPKAFLLN